MALSGGAFAHQQYCIGAIADEIVEVIERNASTSVSQFGDLLGRGYNEQVLARLRDAVDALRVAQIYAHRVDWLLSDDDGPDSFIARLADNLHKHRAEAKL